jgi:hypothetical protein
MAEGLRSHFAAGRLEVDDLERRLQLALRAETTADLEALSRDLPKSAAAVRTPASAEPVRVRGWGNREFRQEHLLPTRRAAAWSEVMAHIAPAMAAYGYTIVDRHEPDFIVFELAERSAWPLLLLGPLGLFAPGERSRVAVSLVEVAANGTKLVAAGTARRTVRRAFAEISL